MIIKDAKGSLEDIENGPSVSGVLKYLENRNMSLESQDSFSLEAANSLLCKLRAQLESFRYIVDERSPWEEKSAVVKLGNKMQKSKRNKLWRKRKRKRIAEMLAKVVFLCFFRQIYLSHLTLSICLKVACFVGLPLF